MPWAREVIRGTCTIEDGYIVVPDGPSLAVELDEAALARYPYHEKNFPRLFEPGWERRTGAR